MPIRPENKARHPKNWKALTTKLKKAAGNKCEICGARQGEPHPLTGSKVILQVMHMNHVIEDLADSNLKVGCQRCHLRHDEKFHRKNRLRYERKDMAQRLQSSSP